MIDNNTIKANARAQLGNNIFSNYWLMILVCGLIYGVISSVASYVVVGALIVMGPLNFGMARVTVKRACGAPTVEISDVFKGFTDNFTGSLVLGIMQSLFITLWSLLFIVPGIIKAISYSQAPYIIAENPNMPAMEALRRSEEMMRGRKMEYFVLNLSFIGWALLAIPTLGLITIWLEPYMQMTMINFYSDLKSTQAAHNPWGAPPPPPPPPFGEQI
jgi:uncharacterized membrane protein